MTRTTARFPMRSWRGLPARDRAMFTLLCYEKLSPTEIARTLGCTVREVKRTLESRLLLLHRAMRKQAPRPRSTRRPRSTDRPSHVRRAA